MPTAIAQSQTDNPSAGFDLGSTDRTATAAAAGPIRVGDSTRLVNSGESLTAGEFAALGQVLETGRQSLILNGGGAAIGGSLSIQQLVPQASDLVIPQGVSAIHNVASASHFNLTGTLTNAGNIYAVTSNASSTAGFIAASSIFNLQTGLISSALPEGLSGFLPTAVDLNLSALDALVNEGTISSSGALNILSPLINNTGSVNSGSALSVSAVAVNNSGLLQAAGNLSFINTINPALGLTINNDAGLIKSTAGELSFSVVDDLLKAPMNVLGGTIGGTNVIADAGEGHLLLDVQDIQGPLSLKAGTARLLVRNATGGLIITQYTVTGDPDLFFNGPGPFSSPGWISDGGFVDVTTTAGDITFTAPINTTPSAVGPGGYVRLVSSGNIFTQDITTTGNTNGNGGNVTLTASSGITTGTINASGGTTSGQAGSIAATSAGNMTLGDITLNGQTGGGVINLQTQSDLTVGAISGTGITGAVNLLADTDSAGGGAFNLTAGRTINTNNNGLVIEGYGFQMNGGSAINAGSATVQLRPSAALLADLVSVGDIADGNGNDLPFDINLTEMESITAGSLIIGDFIQGNVLVQGNLDISGSGPGGYNLELRAGCNCAPFVHNMNSSGTTITIGANSLFLDAGFSNTIGSISSTTGAITATAYHQIDITGSVIATGAAPMIFTADKDNAGGGEFRLFAGNSVSTNNAPISITAGGFILNGASTVSAGTGTVSIAPSVEGTISLGDAADGNGNDAMLDINASELGSITADTLRVGSLTVGDDFTILGPINVSGAGAGAYNLEFLVSSSNVTDTYIGTGQTITLGARSLMVSGGVDGFTGNVTGTTGSATFSFLDDVVVTGNISFTGAGNITLIADADAGPAVTGGDIIINTARTVSTAGGAILMEGVNFVVQGTGTANAGTGTINIQPSIDTLTIGLGDNADGDGDDRQFDINAAELTALDASLVTIGQFSNTGGVTVQGTMNLATTGFDLLINHGGNYTSNAGVSATLGAQDLVVSVLGTVSTGGATSTGGGSYSIFADNTITIDGVLSGPSLAFITPTDILTAAGAGAISSQGAAGSNGGSILMVSGAAFTRSAPTAVEITGGSAGGGAISLAGANPITSLNTRGNGAGTNGGDIMLIAYSGASAGSGVATLPAGVTVRTGGVGSGSNGNITIIAGSNAAGNGISAGQLVTSGGSGGNGNIVAAVSLPSISASGAGCSPCVRVLVGGAMDAAAGQYSPGALGAANLSLSHVSTQSIAAIDSDAGDITLSTGGALTTGNVSASADYLNFANGNGGDGGDVLITAGQNILVGDVRSNGTNGGTTSGLGGNSGVISITSSAGSITVNGEVMTLGTNQPYWIATGAGGTSGDITISAFADININNPGQRAISIYGGPGGLSDGIGQDGGDLTVVSTTGSITLDGFTEIYGGPGGVTTAGGSSGDLVMIAAGDITATDYISAGGSSGGTNGGSGGTGGNISLTSTGGSINGTYTSIYGGDVIGATGDGGDTGGITLNAASDISFTDIFTISGGGGTTSGNSGNAGGISVSSGGALMIAGGQVYSISGDTVAGNTGNTGAVNITAASVTSTGGSIGSYSGTSSNSGITGDAGNVSLTATGGVISISGAIESLAGSSASGIGGNSGDVTLSASDAISAGGSIQSYGGNGTTAGGNGGSLNISSTGGGLSTPVDIISSGGTATVGAGGSAANITINVSGNISMPGADSDIWSMGQSGGTVSGNAGFVSVTSTGGSLSIGDDVGNAVDASVNGNGASTGPVTINVATTLSMGPGGGVWSLAGNAGGSGNGGNAGAISVTAPSGMTLGDAILVLAGNGSGAAGNGGIAGNITASAASGGIAVGSRIETLGGNGNGAGGAAGSITVSARDAIATTSGGIMSLGGDGNTGGGNTGALSITSTNSTITVGAKILTEGGWSVAGGAGGSGGNVTVSAQGNILLTAADGDIWSIGRDGGAIGGTAGNVLVTSTAGSVTAWQIGVSSGNSGAGNGASAGDLTINVGGSINVPTGGIWILAGNGGGNGDGGNAGVMTITAPAGITTGNSIFSNGGDALGVSGNGGSVGSMMITAGTINSGFDIGNFGGIAGNGDGGDAGAVTIVSTGAITSAGSIYSLGGSGTANGGRSSQLTVTAVGNINATNGYYSFGGNGALGGTGEDVILTSSAGNIISASGISARPGAGGSNSGSDIILNAAGTVQFNAGFDANATGAGTGGDISVTYNSATALTIGGAVGANYINGLLEADSATGTGGNISFTNNAAAPLDIDLNGTISANGTNLGTITFNKPGNVVDVQGTGSLIGRVFATGTSVTINPQAVATTLTIGSIVSTGGATNVIANSAGSAIVLPAGASITGTAGLMTVRTRNLNLGALSSISTTDASNVVVDALSNPMTITGPSGSSATIATNDGRIDVAGGSTSSLTFAQSGAGGTSIVFNAGGTGDVFIEPSYDALSGSITINPNVTVACVGCSDSHLHAQTITVDTNATWISDATTYHHIETGNLVNNGTIASNSLTEGIEIEGRNSDITLSGTPVAMTALTYIYVFTANNNDIFFNSSYSFDAGSGNPLLIDAGGGQVTLANNVSISAINTNTIDLQATSLVMGSNSVLNSTAAAGTAVLIDNGATAAALNIVAPTGGSATISSAGGAIDIMPTAALNFTQSGAGSATLNVNGGAVTASTPSTITINSGVTVASNNNVTLQTTAGNSSINLGGNVTATVSTVTVNANGSGSINRTVAGAMLTGNIVNLVSGTGNIGSAANNILTSAGTLTANTALAGTGDVYITQTGPVSLGASNAGDLFELSSSGQITTAGVVEGNHVNLTTTAGNAGIVLGANVRAVETPFVSTVTLTANGSGSITQSGGSVAAFNQIYNSTSGDIGGPGAAAIDMDIYFWGSNDGLHANTAGNAYFNELDRMFVGASTVGGTFNVVAGGTIVTNGVISAGALQLTETGTGLLTRGITIGAAINANSINMAAGDDITIGAALNSNGGALALITTTDVVTAAGAGALSTQGGAGANGGNLLLVAGGNWSAGAGGTIDITGVSASGGTINLAGATPITSLVTSGNGAGTAGGDVTLISYANGGVTGTITLPAGVAISTGSGQATATGGDVTIIAAANAGTAISLAGGISTGAGAGGGNLNIDVANVSITASAAGCSPCVQVLSNGGVSGAAGSFTAGAALAGNVTAGTLNTAYGVGIGASPNSGDLRVATGGTLNLGDVFTVPDPAGSAVANGGNGGDLTLIAGVDINTGRIAGGAGNPGANGDGGTGGNVLLLAGNNITTSDGVTTYGRSGGASSGLPGSGGSITIIATNGFINIAGSASAGGVGNGIGSTPGDITITANGDIDIGFGVGSYGGDVVGGTSGDVSITSTSGHIALPGGIEIYGGDGTATVNGGASGAMTLNASTSITAAYIDAFGGNGGASSAGGATQAINLTAGTTISVPGGITVSAGNGGTTGGAAGTVTISGTGNVTLNDVLVQGGNGGSGAAGSTGNVLLASTGGTLNVTTTTQVFGGNSTSGAGGATGPVNLQGDAITLGGGLQVFGGNGGGNGSGGAAGNTTLTATNAISVTSAQVFGGNAGATGGNGGAAGLLSITSAAGAVTSSAGLFDFGGNASSGSGGSATGISVNANSIAVTTLVQTLGGDTTGGGGNGGDAGIISLTSAGSITVTGAISSLGGNGNGAGIAGDNAAVTVNAGTTLNVTGNIDLRTGTGAPASNPGDSTITAAGNVTIGGAIIVYGLNGGSDSGDISVTSTGGSLSITGIIDIEGGDSATVGGSAGDLILNAFTTITLGNSIDSFGGDVTGPNGNAGSGGDITIIADGDISIARYVESYGRNGGATSGLGGNGGAITIISNNGGVTVTGSGSAGVDNGGGAYSAALGRGGAQTGDITISARNNISIGNVLGSYGGQGKAGFVGGNSGNIAVTSTTGFIQVTGIGAIENIAGTGPSGAGDTGTTSLTAATTITGDYLIVDNCGGAGSCGSVVVSGNGGNLGDISLTAGGNITFGSSMWAVAETGGSTAGNGGSVGNIAVVSTGGNITFGDSIGLFANDAPNGLGGSAGTVTVTSAGAVNLGIGGLYTRGGDGATGGGNVGDIILNASSFSFGEEIVADAGSATVSGVGGSAGNISLNTTGDITGFAAISLIWSIGGNGISGAGNSGNVSIISTAGNLDNIVELGTAGGDATAANGGSTGSLFVQTGGFVNVGNGVWTVGGDAGATNIGGAAGPLTVLAGGSINVGDWVGSRPGPGGSTSGNAGAPGNVTVTSTGSSITVGAGVTADGGTVTAGIGNAGNVTLTAATTIAVTDTISANGTGGGTNGTVTLNAGTVSTANSVSGGNVIITTAPAANGSIVLGANVIGTIDVSLTATGTGTITQTGGSVTSPVLNLNAGGGAITLGATDVGTLNTNTTGSVTLSGETNGIALNNIVADSLTITAGGNITTGPAFSVTNLTLATTAASSGNITFGGNVTGTASITLTAGGNGGISQSAGALSGPNAVLNAGIGGINFTGANSLNATTLSAISAGSVNIDDTAAGVITLNGSSAGNNPGDVFVLNATAGNIVTAGPVSGYDVTLSASTAPGQTVTLGSSVTGANSVTIISSDNLTDGATVGLNAPNITLTSTFGDVTLTGSYSATASITLSATAGTVTVGDAVSGPVVNVTGGVEVLIQTGGSLTSNAAGSVNITTPLLTLEDTAVIDAAASSTINIGNAGNMTVNINGAGTPTAFISSAGGQINVNPTGNLTIGLAGGAASGTLDLSGGITDIRTTAAALTINNAVTISSDNSISVALPNGGTITNNGTLTTSSGTLLVWDATVGSNLTIAGTGSLINTGSAETAIGTFGQTLTLSGNQTISNSAGGDVQNIYANHSSTFPTGNIVFGAGASVTFAGTGPIEVDASNLVLGNGASINASAAGIPILVAPHGVVHNHGTQNSDLTVTVATGGTASIQTNGGNINFSTIDANQSMTFSPTAGGAATLNANGGFVQTFTDGSTTTVATGMTLASDNNMTFNVSNGTMTNDGVVTTSGPLAGLWDDGAQINVNHNGNLTLTGNGTFSTTNAGANGIQLGDMLSGPGNVTYSATYTIDPGNGAGAGGLSSGVNGQLIFTNGSSWNVVSGAVTNIRTPNLVAPSGGTATIDTDGGDIDFNRYYPGGIGNTPLQFSQSGAGGTTMQMTGGYVYAPAITTLTIDAGVTLSLDNNAGFELIGGGTLTNNGVVTTSNNAGVFLLTSTAGLTLDGTNGIFQITGAGPAVINTSALAGGTLTLNGVLDFDLGAGVGNSTSFESIAPGGTVVIGAGADYQVIGGSTFIRSDSGGITVNGQFASNNDLRVFTLAGNADITLNGTLSGSNTINMTTDGSGDVIYVSGALNTFSLSLNSTTGNMGSAASRIQTNVNRVAANTGGDAYITESNNVQINASTVDDFVLTTTALTGTITAGGDLTANSAILTAGTGGITFTAANSLESNNMTLVTTGSANVVSNVGGTITLNTSSAGNGAGNIFALNATAANISISGTVSAFNVDLRTTSAAGRDITVGADINAVGTATLTVLGSGNILQNAGAVITANTVVLSAVDGNIGAPLAPMLTNTVNLDANGNNAVYIVENDAVNVISMGAGDFAGMDFSLQTLNPGDVNVLDGIFMGGVLTLQTTGSSLLNIIDNVPGDITVNGGINLTSQQIQIGTGSLLISATTATVTTSQLTIEPTGAITSTGANVVINGNAGSNLVITNDGNLSAATTLTVSNNQNVTINGAGTLAGPGGITLTSTTGLVSATQNTFTGNISGNAATTFGVTATVSNLNILNIGATDIDLNATLGDIIVNGNVNGTTTVNLTTGAGSILSTAGSMITSPALTLTTTGGDAGTAVAPVRTSVGNLTMSVGGAGDVFIDETNNITLLASTIGGNLYLLTTGSVSNGAIVAASGGMTLRTPALTNTGTLSAGTTLTVSNAAGVTVSGAGQLTAVNIDFNSTAGAVNSTQANFNGLVGGTAGGAFNLQTTAGGINAGTISAATLSLTTADTQTITIVAGNTINSGNASLNTGNATVNGDLISTGTIDVSSATGALAFAGNGTLSSAGGTTLTAVSGALSITGSVTTTGATTLQATGAGGQVSTAAGSTYTSTSINVDSANLANAGSLIANGGDLTVNSVGAALTVTNGGLLSATGDLIMSTNFALTVSGVGQLTGTTGISMISSGDSVTVTQDDIDNPISGSAATFFTVTTNVSNLIADTITASGGDLTLNASAADLSLVGGGALTASANIMLTANTNISIAGGGTAMTAGTLAGGASPASTNLNAWDMGSVVTAGVISLVATTGDITSGNGIDLTAQAGNVQMWSGGDIILGDNNSLFAQAGNVWINATGIANVGTGANFTAVARYQVAGTVIIDGTTIRDFQGGGIAIYSGVPAANLDTELWNQAMARVASPLNINPGAPTANYNWVPGNITTPNSGSVAFIGAGQIDVLGATLSANGGVIRLDPIGDPVFVAGGFLNAFGPALVFVPPPPPPVPGAPIAVAVILNPLIPGAPVLINTNLTSSIPPGVPADSTKLASINLSTTLGENFVHQCVPLAMATFSEAGGETWSVASGMCQGYSTEDNSGTAMVGTSGTTLAATSPNSVKLKNGKMLAMAGKDGLVVETASGKVTLKSDSSAIIEESPSGVMRVSHLTGDASSIEVGKDANRKVLTANEGEELIIAEVNANDEELIPIDGVDRIAIGASIKVMDKKVKMNRFDQKQMIAKEPLLNCSGGCVPKRIQQKFNKVRDTASGDKPLPPKAKLEQHDSIFTPVARVQTSTLPPSRVITTRTPGFRIKHDGSAVVSVDAPDQLTLKKGELVLVTDKKMSVRGDRNIIAMDAGVIAVVSMDKGILRVRNVWEPGAKSTNVYVGNRSIPVGVGEEVVVASSDKELQQAMKSDAIGRRRVRKSTLQSGGAVLASEVSFLSLTRESRALRMLLNSDDEEDKAVSDKIAKMAVILSVVTGKHGAYSPMKP